MIEKSGGFEIGKGQSGVVCLRRRVARCRVDGKGAAWERERS